jgi:hypothetical protein
MPKMAKINYFCPQKYRNFAIYLMDNGRAAICNVESTRSLDHGSYAALSTVSTWMGDRHKRVNHIKDWLALLLAGCCVAS